MKLDDPRIIDDMGKKIGRPVSTGRDESSTQVVVRLNAEETSKLDGLRGPLTRAEYLRRLLGAKKPAKP